MSAFLEFQQDLLLLGVLVVLLSVVPAVPVGPGSAATPGGPPREPGWKKYLKYLGWLLLATLLGCAFFYVVGSTTGDDPPGTPPAPWTPAGLPTELFDRRGGWTAEEWADHVTWTTDQQVYDAVGRFVELKSNRVLKPEVVRKLADILGTPATEDKDLTWYIRQRMVETAPQEIARATEVVRQSLESSHEYRDACREGIASVAQHHGTRIHEFGVEYKQKR